MPPPHAIYLAISNARRRARRDLKEGSGSALSTASVNVDATTDAVDDTTVETTQLTEESFDGQEQCPAGTYSLSGASYCVYCDAGSYTNLPAQTSAVNAGFSAAPQPPAGPAHSAGQRRTPHQLDFFAVLFSSLIFDDTNFRKVSPKRPQGSPNEPSILHKCMPKSAANKDR